MKDGVGGCLRRCSRPGGGAVTAACQAITVARPLPSSARVCALPPGGRCGFLIIRLLIVRKFPFTGAVLLTRNGSAVSSLVIDIEAHTFHSPDLESVVAEAADFLIQTPEYPLSVSGNFVGVGIYAIYYSGSSGYYKKISALNRVRCRQPIYIGKAVPAGWRTARKSAVNDSYALCNRLREHTRSIEQGKGIRVVDFKCRFMILLGVETDLISAVEARLIRDYMPLWNTLIDGFGNHDPGKGRYNQARSEWDVLHPGRSWAKRLTGISSSRAEIIRKIFARR